MYCTKCGNVVPEDAAFCRICGNAVTTVSPAIAAESSPAVPLEPSIAVATPSVASRPLGSYPPAASISPSLMAPYAGFWLRVVAYLIDSAVLTVAFGAVVAIGVASFGMRFFRGFVPGGYDGPNVSYEAGYPLHPFFPAAALGVLLVLLPITIVTTWLYFALMEASFRQGTLGKIALGLFVTDLQGRRISFGRASGRFFAKIITGLIPLFIGYMMAGFTEKRQALHDMIAGCLVLKKL
jgi:uncharacterized RDD family membrane protein YckC